MSRSILESSVLGIVVTLAVVATASLTWGQDAADAGIERVEITLENGRVETRRLLAGLYEAMGKTPPASPEKLDWSLDLRSALGVSTFETLERATGGALTVEVTPARATIALDRGALETRLDEAGQTAEAWLDSVAGALASGPATPIPLGLTFVADDDDRLPLADYVARLGPGANDAARRPVVVLVHGLDDPGWIWRDVIPALRAAGYDVARMRYANDGPIADAADRFAAALLDLRAAGVRRLDVVAHSMGGLVTRDVLTRAPYYGGDGTGGDRFPAVDRVVLCGTPNHGAKIVRLRAISEIKEQISRTFSGDGGWLGGLADGAGEAAVDLEPESVFLRRLNDRPRPTHTRMTIIAGRMSPVEERELSDLGRKIREAAESASAPAWLRDWIAEADDRTSSLLGAAVRGLGDGCVSIESAQLSGVSDFVVVPANHVSMIVRVVPAVEDTPPAIPLILDRLGRPRE